MNLQEVKLRFEIPIQLRRTHGLLKRGEYQKALRVALTTLDLASRLNDPLITAQCYNLAGSCFIYVADTDKALPLLEESVAIRKREMGNHPHTVNSLNNLAKVYEQRCQYERALSLYEEAVHIARNIPGNNVRSIVTLLCNWAGCCTRAGQYSEARRLAGKALEIARTRLGRDYDTALALNLAGSIHLELGQFHEAIPLLQEALAMMRSGMPPGHPQIATSVSNLAAAYEGIGEIDLALQFYEEVLAGYRKGGEPSNDLPVFLHNLASVYQRGGRYEEAMRLMDEALQVHHRFSHEDHFIAATLLGGKSSLYAEQREYERALPLARETLEINQRVFGSSHPSTADSEIFLALLYAQIGQYDTAIPHFAEGLRSQDELMRSHFRFMPEGERLRYSRQFQASLFIACEMIVTYRASDTAAVTMLFEAILRRKEAETLLMAAQREAVLGDRPEYTPYRRDLVELLAVKSRLAHVALQNALDPELPRLQANADEIERRLSEVIPELIQERLSMTATRQAIAGNLPGNTALIEFLKYRYRDPQETAPAAEDTYELYDHYLAFVVTPEKLDLIQLGLAKPIDAQVTTLLRAVDTTEGRGGSTIPYTDTNWDKQARPPLKALYADVIKPLLPLLEEKYHWLVAPDGPLAFVPFDLLEDAEGISVGSTVAVSYVVSGRDVSFLQQATQAEGKSVLVADPNFRLGCPSSPVTPPPSEQDLSIWSDISFAPLPGTQLEAECLQSRFGNRLYRDAATTVAVRQQVHRPKIWHCSTHAYVLEDIPLPEFSVPGPRPHRQPLDNPLLRAGIAFAGAKAVLQGIPLPESFGTGVLTAYDLSQLDLRGTFLTLAACKSARGYARIGQGVMGIRSALTQAGVRTALLTLWPVNDLATAIFMEMFYQQLLDERMPPLVALRNAQEYLRTVEVGTLKKNWFNAVKIQQLTQWAEEASVEDRDDIFYPLLDMVTLNADRPNDTIRLYSSPVYWGAFVLQGNLTILE